MAIDIDPSLRSLIGRFAGVVGLNDEDRSVLEQMSWQRVEVRQHRDILVRGEKPSGVYIVTAGWAARYNVRSDGSRRITGFLLPGDLCGFHSLYSMPLDHAVTALSDCSLRKVSGSELADLVTRRPTIGAAISRAKLVETAALRIWLLNSAKALQTVAHLLCELDVRLHPGPMAHSRKLRILATQEQLSDAVSMTGVHFNRVLRELREAKLIETEKRSITLLDVPALRRVAAFDPSYLNGWRA